MELWIPLTILAAFFQNLRSAFQKYLKGSLSTAGASYVRFLYAWPFSIIYCFSLNQFGGYPFPQINEIFLLYCLLGGASQIIFTLLLIYLFSFKSFAIGTIYSKTEVVQVALLSLILLGDEINILTGIAILISVIGVMVLSASKSKITIGTLFQGIMQRTTLIGLLCGAFLGASSVFYRGASLALNDSEIIMKAAFSLAIALTIQSILMGAYLKVREAKQISAIIKNWKPALIVGISGVLGSICWFTAFTAQNAAYVRALGQIELIFTFIASLVFFKEKTNLLELTGITAIIIAIIILLLNTS